MRRESPLDKQKGVQGSQFTAAAFTGALLEAGVGISMDGRGRWMDNVFIERIWRSLKYEDIYPKGYADGGEAKAGIGEYFAFYNERRLHQAHRRGRINSTQNSWRLDKGQPTDGLPT